MGSPRRALTVVDRTMIEVRLRDGWGIRAIAASLGRSGGTISDEIARHRDSGGGYRAQAACVGAAAARRLSGRKPRLGVDGALFGEVAGLLRRKWSPEQISGRRLRIEDGMERHSGLSVSHEAIDTAIDALPRGELRRELISCLRQDKPMRGRKPKGSERRGKLVNMTNIKERPQEIEGRLVPGHWEGDFILGAGGSSAIGTLVERTMRLVVLVRMPTRKADVAACAFAGALNAIPAPLRQYFPKGMSFAALSQNDLDTVATSLNDRPRKTLDFATPGEQFNSMMATMAAQANASPGGVRSQT